MNDISILFMYVVVFSIVRSANALLALFVWVIVSYTAYKVKFTASVDDVYLFLCLSAVYSFCALFEYRNKNHVWVGYVFVLSYYLYYSYDSWINAEHETWVWSNHEILVFAAHSIVVLLLGKVHITLVRSSYFLFGRRGRDSQSNKSC
ncbi:hypothetical protein [Alteromonas phage XX1924]|nr:hypothetical protein [Alteromonas phage XX1924]